MKLFRFSKVFRHSKANRLVWILIGLRTLNTCSMSVIHHLGKHFQLIWYKCLNTHHQVTINLTKHKNNTVRKKHTHTLIYHQIKDKSSSHENNDEQIRHWRKLFYIFLLNIFIVLKCAIIASSIEMILNHQILWRHCNWSPQRQRRASSYINTHIHTHRERDTSWRQNVTLIYVKYDEKSDMAKKIIGLKICNGCVT